MKLTIARPVRVERRRPTRETTYHIFIHEWDLIPYLWAKLYHWYDMRIPVKVPGWKAVEWILRRCGGSIGRGMGAQFEGEEAGEPRWRDRLLAWSYSQDIRCFHLNDDPEEKHHRWVTTVDVDRQTYESFRR